MDSTVYANGGMMLNGGASGMSQAQSVLNWNPNQLDIKTKSVEQTLEPLVLQVSSSGNPPKMASNFHPHLGHDISVFQITSKEKGEIQKSTCSGGSSGTSHNQFRGKRPTNRPRESRHRT